LHVCGLCMRMRIVGLPGLRELDNEAVIVTGSFDGDVARQASFFIAVRDHIGSDLVDRQGQLINCGMVETGRFRGSLHLVSNRTERVESAWERNGIRTRIHSSPGMGTVSAAIAVALSPRWFGIGNVHSIIEAGFAQCIHDGRLWLYKIDLQAGLLLFG